MESVPLSYNRRKMVDFVIIYTKLGQYLKEHNMKYIDLQRNMNLSPTIIAKFQKNRSVTIDTIDKVCAYLHVQPGDIMEWIEDESVLQEREIETKIKVLQKQLAELKANK